MIVNPKQVFKAVKYSGSSSTPLDVRGVGFKPDLTWVKATNHGWGHGLFSSLNTKGASDGHKYVWSDKPDGESDQWGAVKFEADGWSGVGSSYDSSNSFAHDFGGDGKEFISWNWKAGGAPEAGFQTNDAMVDEEAALCSDIAAKAGATITPTSMSVGTETGFSITTYTGQNISVRSIPHGLNKRPDMFIVKQLDDSNPFMVWHSSFSDSTGDFIRLNTSQEKDNSSNFWGGEPNDSLIYVGSDSYSSICGNNMKYICYAWHSVPGYSAFGSYTGNGSADGPFVYTGFKPAFLITKRRDSSSSGDWNMVDNARATYNPVGPYLYANEPTSEGSAPIYNFLSNGFNICEDGAGTNSPGDVYIYMAFAEQPYEFATGR